MIESLVRNIQLVMVFVAWTLAAYLFDSLATAIVAPFLILFWSKKMYQELLFGFIFILILSDNVFPDDTRAYMSFAKDFKNIYMLFLLFVFIVDYRVLVIDNYLFKLMIPFLLIAVFCLIFSPNVFVSVQKTISYAILFLVAPCLFVKCYSDGGREFLRDFLFILMTFILVGFVFMITNPEVCHSHGGRYRGIFGNPNGLGVFLIITFLLYFIIDSYYPDLLLRSEKLLFWGMFLLCTYSTGSRNAFIAIMLFLLFVRVFRWNVAFGMVFFMFTLLVTEYVVANFTNIVINLGLQNVFRIDTLEEGSGRFIAWKFAWDNIQQSLLVGKGFAYDEYLMRSNFEYLSKLGHEGGVHNTYLILWLNTGLLGLLAFLRALFLVFIRASRNTPIAIPVLLAVMFSINFEPWLAASLNPYTILFVCAIVIMTDEHFQQEKIVTDTLSAEYEEAS